MSLRIRVVLVTGLTTIVVMILAGGALLALFGREERQDLDRRLEEQAQVAANRVAVTLMPDRPRAVEEVPSGSPRPEPEPRRCPRGRRRPGRWRHPLDDAAPAETGFSTVETDGERWRVLSLAVDEAAPQLLERRRVDEDEVGFTTLEVAVPLDELEGIAHHGWRARCSASACSPCWSPARPAGKVPGRRGPPSAGPTPRGRRAGHEHPRRRRSRARPAGSG
ncbi:MAG: hypothetical protein U5R31_06365 [Acidimicrobiia bacterium]|nr:hypothetical protein [Acidimicrobiia bacterium]